VPQGADKGQGDERDKVRREGGEKVTRGTRSGEKLPAFSACQRSEPTSSLGAHANQQSTRVCSACVGAQGFGGKQTRTLTLLQTGSTHQHRGRRAGRGDAGLASAGQRVRA
jgi:hypothetical protein